MIGLLLALAVVCHARDLLLNDVQVKGSHFSFHLAPNKKIPFLDYSHEKINVQLKNQGVRAVEIKFKYTTEDLPVFATPEYDGNTNCPNLSFCLRDVRNFTIAHPKHPPVFVILESASLEAYSAWVWDWFDTVITSIWPKNDIIKPGDVMGTFDNLRDAIKTRGWPSLKSCLGKVIIFLRVNQESYAGEGDLRNRIGFPIYPPAKEGDPNAVIFEQNNALYSLEQLQTLVRQNYLVITKADSTFVPAGTEVYDNDAFFNAVDLNWDNVASVQEINTFFLEVIGDLHDYLTTKERLKTAIDSAIYTCAGANAQELSKAQFECLMSNIKSFLPSPESITSARARLSAAQKSGAQIILTKHPAAPFTGAPSDTYLSVDLSEQCNPVTTCECFAESYIAADKCSTGSSSSATACVAISVLLFVLAVFA